MDQLIHRRAARVSHFYQNVKRKLSSFHFSNRAPSSKPSRALRRGQRTVDSSFPCQRSQMCRHPGLFADHLRHWPSKWRNNRERPHERCLSAKLANLWFGQERWNVHSVSGRDCRQTSARQRSFLYQSRISDGGRTVQLNKRSEERTWVVDTLFRTERLHQSLFKVRTFFFFHSQTP